MNPLTPTPADWAGTRNARTAARRAIMRHIREAVAVLPEAETAEWHYKHFAKEAVDRMAAAFGKAGDT